MHYHWRHKKPSPKYNNNLSLKTLEKITHTILEEKLETKITIVPEIFGISLNNILDIA